MRKDWGLFLMTALFFLLSWMGLYLIGYQVGIKTGYNRGYEQAQEDIRRETNLLPPEENQTGGQSKTQLSILSQKATIDGEGIYHVTGEVQNKGDVTASYVRVKATFYDSNNTVVDVGEAYLSSINLQPGQKASFDVTNQSKTTTSNIRKYRLDLLYE